MSKRCAGIALACALIAGPALAACGSDEPAESAAELLERAKDTLDDAESVHFVLESDGAPDTGTVLIGGEGDVARPASFDGTLQVRVNGAVLDLDVVSVEGTVYALLPFASSFDVIEPAQFGFGDPGALLDPETGISQFLAQAEDAELGDERRVGGEVVREVSAELPGDLVEQVLTSEDPSRPVQALLSIATDTGEVRRVELTGPFFSTEDSTFIVELSDFGADVEITAPPTD